MEPYNDKSRNCNDAIASDQFSSKKTNSTMSVTESSVTVVVDNQYFDSIREFVARNLNPQVDAQKIKTISMKNRSIKFPVRLMFALDHSDPAICTWSEDGKSFIILDKTRFEKEVLPKNFKDAKFNSFLRKLYRWGFVKKSEDKIGMRYIHQLFNKENYSLCMEMTCTDSTKARSIRIQEEIAAFQANQEMKRNSVHSSAERISKQFKAVSHLHRQQKQKEDQLNLINQLKAQNDFLIQQLVNNSSIGQDLIGQDLIGGQGLQLPAAMNDRAGLKSSLYQDLTSSASRNQTSSSSTNPRLLSTMNLELAASNVNPGLSSLIDQALATPSNHNQLLANHHQALSQRRMANNHSQDDRIAAAAASLNSHQTNLNRLVVSNRENGWNQPRHTTMDQIHGLNPTQSATAAPLSVFSNNTTSSAASLFSSLDNPTHVNTTQVTSNNDHLYEQLQEMMNENRNLREKIMNGNHESVAKRPRTEQ